MEAIGGGASLIQSSNLLLRDQRCSFSSPGRWRGVVRLEPVKLRSSISWSRSDFYGERIRSVAVPKRPSCRVFSVDAQMITGNLGLAKAQKWWEKGLKPNMKEVTGAQNLVDFLLNAGDKLVVVVFFSPGCGGCKALHPKLFQLAEMNPDVQFLQVNYEEHKSMCYSLGVHVLPFFRFYRGAQGKICSFSCTNATIKKFKDALAKHTPDRCSLGPTKGLEEKELLALSANREVPFTYTPKQIPAPEKDVSTPEPVPSYLSMDFLFLAPKGGQKPSQESEERTLVNSGR